MTLDHLLLSRELTVEKISLGVGKNSDHLPIKTAIAPRTGGVLCPEIGNP
jgi:endonuclease/exonuclease/phosphatase family metal-dependent hydrolase